MKILDVSSISPSAQMPLKSGTLQFVQDAYKEIVSNMIIAMIGGTYDPTKVYILYGLSTSNWVTPNFSCPAGAVFYDGEVFAVAATSYGGATGVPVFNINTAYYTTNADPVTFSDSNQYNIHQIRTMTITDGVSGSGLSDFTDAIFGGYQVFQKLNLNGTGTATVSGIYPNLTIDVPATSNLLWLGTISADGLTVTKQAGSLASISVVRTGTGAYTVTHNIGNTNYYINGIGYNSLRVSPRSYNPGTNSFTYLTSDDSSANDGSVQLEIKSF